MYFYLNKGFFPFGANLFIHKIDQDDPGIEDYLSKLSLIRNKSEVVYIVRYIRESHIFPIVLADEQSG